MVIRIRGLQVWSEDPQESLADGTGGEHCFRNTVLFAIICTDRTKVVVSFLVWPESEQWYRTIQGVIVLFFVTLLFTVNILEESVQIINYSTSWSLGEFLSRLCATEWEVPVKHICLPEEDGGFLEENHLSHTEVWTDCCLFHQHFSREWTTGRWTMVITLGYFTDIFFKITKLACHFEEDTSFLFPLIKLELASENLNFEKLVPASMKSLTFCYL